MNKSEIIAQAAEYLDVFTSKMEKMPDTANVKRLVAELYAIAASAGDAPAVQGEPVGWQFYQDGKWWHGDDRIKDHRKNTEEAGYPIREVYAVPQPAPDVAELVEALEEMVAAMHDYEMAVGDTPPHRHLTMMRKAEALIATHRKQEEES